MVTYKEFIYSDYFKTELPTHWQEKRLGFLAIQTRNAFVDGPFGSDLKSDDYLDEGVPLIQLNNIRDGKHILRNMKFISDAKKKSLIRHLALPQDIVIAKMAEPVARAAVVSGEYAEYVIVADCVKLTPNLKLVDLDFLIWAINSDCVRENAELVSTGTTRIRINLGELKKLKVPYPSLSEQIQIRTFLDHETAKIDSLIEKQQQLIELLKEKRQAVISHAVTKGLNPDVPMKDSGVEWLGQVPEHWGITKLKWKAITTSGSTPTTSKYELYYENGNIPWIRTTDLNNSDLYETPISITSKGVYDTACSILPINSILIAMYGGAGSIGKHALLKFESTINQAVCGVLPSKYFNSDYLHRFYEFYRPFWMIGAMGTRKDPNIGQDHIKEATVLLPPLKEQEKIAKYILDIQLTYDNLTNRAEAAIHLMQERRTALISAAVRGKIDVRNWQNPTEAKMEFSA
jgi:type I restriction enzyme S subunit